MTSTLQPTSLFEELRDESSSTRATAISAINAFRLFGVDSVMCSFNGGKDATVAMHIARFALQEFTKLNNLPPRRLKCCFWVHKHEFPEIEQFVEKMAKEYDLELWEFEGGFKEGLRECVENRGIRAVIMGTRLSDPDGHQVSVFEPSSLRSRSTPPLTKTILPHRHVTD
eukprot:c5758_g1_i2.p1 GENE.c5758_g1_i2~~c5758_g1_i2.p1  ORF type:complete len:170 (-),score=19.65 c5758_g1_i2:313-822(-)